MNLKNPKIHHRTPTGPARRRVVYFGSCNNIFPVHEYPGIDFVFITPEPNHPVAKEHWPKPCYGSVLYSTEALFMNAILSPLGPTWRLVQKEERLWVFRNGTRFLRVHVNSTIEDHTPEARDDIATSDAWMLGFCFLNLREQQRVFDAIGLDETRRWLDLEYTNNRRVKHYVPDVIRWEDITPQSKWVVVEDSAGDEDSSDDEGSRGR